jgi:hypothetical protein
VDVLYGQYTYVTLTFCVYWCVSVSLRLSEFFSAFFMLLYFSATFIFFLSLSLISLSYTHTHTHIALKIAAVDCEMCDTANGLELTRLTILDQNHVTVLDTLVKPRLPIVNYRTQWSGVTEALLERVTVTLEQAQLAFMRIISRETFLIGEFYIILSILNEFCFGYLCRKNDQILRNERLIIFNSTILQFL